MPVNVRVNVPDFKAEVDLSCDLHGTSFWQLKLCLVDGLLSLHKNATSSKQATSKDCPEKRPLIELVTNTLKGRKQDNSRNSKSCMQIPTTRSSTNSIVPTYRRSQNRLSSVVSSSRCNSSASSLSLSDNSTSSQAAFEASNFSARSNRLIFGRSQSQNRVSQSTESSSSACYYGFNGVSLSDWDDDNARQPNDLSDNDEDAAVKAIVMATADPDCCHTGGDEMSTNGNYNECTSSSESHFNDDSCNRRISDLLELDERDEYNVYECLKFGGDKSGDSGTCSDRVEDSTEVESTEVATESRLFEQLLKSGFLNYGFYSFSLARFIDDQTNLTDYLTLVSSSTGASYYLDLEFKLKRRQQSTSSLLRSGVYAPYHDNNANYTFQLSNSRDAVGKLGLNINVNVRTQHDATSLKSNRLHNLSFSSLNSRMKRSISNCSSESRTSQPIIQNQQASFTNNMIAKLASSNGANPQKASSSQTATSLLPSSSQSKRKRSKLLDLLLNTNWSKQSQESANLMKLNKVLLVCDANFLDEKTGESPLSLAITSYQINYSQTTTKSNRSRPAGTQLISSTNGCPQSTSLFDIQSQQSSTSHNLLTLHQTSAIEISQSKAPVVERILLLLIKSGALIDFRNNDGRTPLHVAAKVNNFWALKTLLDLEACPSAIDINGLTPLFYSILHKAELKVTQLLLIHMNSNKNPSSLSQPNGQTTSGNCMEIIDQHGWQAIHYAAKYGLNGHLEKLLYHGCDINAKIRGSGNTPLHVAAINDQLQVAKVLLLRGADRTITNNSHQTAHQVAVISDNMNLAEFIASHDETKVIPFNTSRPSIRHSSTAAAMTNHTSNNRSAISTPNQQLGDSNAPANPIVNNQPFVQQQNFITRDNNMQPSPQERNLDRSHLQQAPSQSNHHQQLNPLTLDVANDYATSVSSSGPTTNTSGTSHQTNQSLLSIDSSSLHNHQLHVQASNISPCLSQRSCGTSNTTTTSSSGVCCDGGDGGHHMDNSSNNNSKSHHSNVTIIAIGNNGKEICNTNTLALVNEKQQQLAAYNMQQQQQQHNASDTAGPVLAKFAAGNNNIANSSLVLESAGFVADFHHHQQQQHRDQRQALDEGINNGQNEGEDLSGSESSSDELYSLMSDRKPLFVGSEVRATNCYESGDPKHLQLRRDDLVEILECPAELIQGGQLPRLANKPMLYGRRQSDGVCGLFPSFCVRRTKQKLTGPRRPMQDVTNLSGRQENLIATSNVAAGNGRSSASCNTAIAIRGSNLPESQSLASIHNNLHQHGLQSSAGRVTRDQHDEMLPPPSTPVSFQEFQVTLTKINEGFGFVLRGARIDPSTISNQSNGTGTLSKISIDESLMAANKLASLQYFSDIEPNSIAHQNGLKRGDFLVSVNNNDVRLCSHEQVVQLIRQSGDKVFLTIARAAPLIAVASKTLNRVKPEPPKRDPTTTLTRNKTLRVKSMCVAPQVQQQSNHMFDPDKPLPSTPQNGMISSPLGLNRSFSTNLSHFSSVNSLSSGALDNQSIASISTLSSIQAPDSSSSTATLTTVATNKPKAAPKPDVTHLKATSMADCASRNQPASMITTNKRQSQERSSLPATANHSTETFSTQKNNQFNDIQMPPPPPPLPDFSITPTKDRLNQRRTSAPINQAAPLISINKNQLIKKRESLAAVGTGSSHTTSNGPAPICAVAAACAAAANNRLQRQQQQQQQQQEKGQESHSLKQKSSGVLSQPDDDVAECPDTPTNTQQQNDPPPKLTNQTKEPERVESYVNETNELPKREEIAGSQGRGMSNHRTVQSATLGRKSSAQIIQQPKQNSNVSQSQTLKISSTKQRMSILDYDSQIFEQKKLVENRQQQARHHYQAHENQQRHQQQQQILSQQPSQQLQFNRKTLDRAPDVDQYSMDRLQNQQQLLLRQQLQQRQIQEQIRMQQQQQHRCHHGANHAVEFGYQTRADNQYPPQHKHSSHNNHHHDYPDTMMTTPQVQQYQHHQHLDQRNHQHNHNHHHHHHHQHPHHHNHHHQQQTPHHLHQQQLAATLNSQRVLDPQNQHGHYHHQHHQRIPQFQTQQQHQQYLQNVNVDPRIAAMNR